MVVDESYRTCQERNRSLSSVDPCCSVAKSNSLWSHGQQHTRLPSPSLPPGVCSDSWPLGWWCYLTISSSAAPLMLLPSIFPSIRVFSNELALHIRWPKYWSFSFSISPSGEYSGLIAFRIDWFDLAVQGILKSSPTPQFKSFNSLAFSLLCGPNLSSILDCWKNIALTIGTFVGKVMSLLFNTL